VPLEDADKRAGGLGRGLTTSALRLERSLANRLFPPCESKLRYIDFQKENASLLVKAADVLECGLRFEYPMGLSTRCRGTRTSSRSCLRGVCRHDIKGYPRRVLCSASAGRSRSSKQRSEFDGIVDRSSLLAAGARVEEYE
jgi:hypothetical protein